MFSKTDGFRDVVICAVEITMTSGAVLTGVIQRPRTKKLGEFLNDSAPFVEVELYEGSTVQVAKSAISHCALRTVPKADQLAQAIHQADIYHPIGTLGLDALRSRDAVQQAYYTRIKQYHVDRYAGVDLPKEVQAYMQDMAARINAAYTDALQMLKTQEFEAERRTAAERRQRPAA